MSKKNKQKVILEDTELKPQVIGYTYQKKNNIFRVIIIFVVFGLAVFYINDISVFINDLIGKNTAPSINNNTYENKNQDYNDNSSNEVIYNLYSDSLEIKENNITLNNFNFENNKLTFDVYNNSNVIIDLTDKKYYVETYTENKTLLERHKLDIKTINSDSKISYQFDINSSFYYLVLEEKSVDDYPVVNLEYDDASYAYIICTKNNETVIYKFNKDKLVEIKNTISESDTNDSNYYTNYVSYQNKAMSYNNMTGITASFNGTLNGFTAIFLLDLQKVNLSLIDEIYYYGYNELPKVVKFEMQTYGFNCS